MATCGAGGVAATAGAGGVGLAAGAGPAGGVNCGMTTDRWLRASRRACREAISFAVELLVAFLDGLVERLLRFVQLLFQRGALAVTHLVRSSAELLAEGTDAIELRPLFVADLPGGAVSPAPEAR